MKLIYVYHSGFVIAGDGFTIVIDYYKDPGQAFIREKILSRPGKFYVLVSHAHPDHFNPEIWEWKKSRPDIRYIFSRDIRSEFPFQDPAVAFLEKAEMWKDDCMRIKAYGSTDIGISFRIEVAGKRIFHAGDLNNWHWKEESTLEEAHQAEEEYKTELEFLARDTDHIDLALFPVDPRLGADYMRGACQFVERIPMDYFVPMHFWENYEKANAFRKFAEERGVKFIVLTCPGESIQF